MSLRQVDLSEVVRKDPRYQYEAYEFLFAALQHTQKMLGRAPQELREDVPANHVTGRQLLDGFRNLALQEYGLMARGVLAHWGIHTTDDVGEMVFNLVEAGLMSKSQDDKKEDFHGVFDWNEALLGGFEIQLEEPG